MSIEKGKITGLQLVFMVTGFVQGSILLVAFTANITKHDTWLVVISSFLVAIPFIFIIAALTKRFTGQNLVQFNDVIFGPFLGKIISVLYIYYFLFTLAFNIRDFGGFYSVFFMPDTPINFFYVFFTLVCAYLVASGIEVCARISHLFVVIAFFIITTTFLLLIKNMDFANFMPVFELSLKDFIHGTQIITIIPFGEIVVFLTIMATLNDYREIKRNTLLGLGLGALSMLVVVVRNTAVLGDSQAILTSPGFQSIRLIEVGNVFTRMDLLVGIGQTLLLLLKSSILYYGVVLSLAQLLRLRTYVPLVLPTGGIVVILASTVFKSAVEHAYWGQNPAAFWTVPFVFIFPLLSLLIAKIRNLPRGK